MFLLFTGKFVYKNSGKYLITHFINLLREKVNTTKNCKKLKMLMISFHFVLRFCKKEYNKIITVACAKTWTPFQL